MSEHAGVPLEDLLGVEVKDVRIAISTKGNARLWIEADGIDMRFQIDLEKYNILVVLAILGEHLPQILIAGLAALGEEDDEARDLLLKVAESQIQTIEEEWEFRGNLEQVNTVDDMFGGEQGTDG